jgi:peroxiredoxin Q/BCP
VLGASADSTADNQKFIDKEKLTFPILCDTDLSLIKALGIKTAKGDMAQRLTFVVDGEGTIKKVYPQVGPQEHPKQVLEYVKSISK